MGSNLLLTWALTSWTAKVLLCSHSDAVVLAAAQVGGLFIKSVADWSFRWVISRGSNEGSDSGCKSAAIFIVPPSRSVPEFEPVPVLFGRIVSGAMSALPISAVAAGGEKLPDGTGKVKSRLASSCEPPAAGAVGLEGAMGNCAETETENGVGAIAEADAGAGAGAEAEAEAEADVAFVGVVFVKCDALDWPINHCKAASSRP